jgi:hypothetical protein
MLALEASITASPGRRMMELTQLDHNERLACVALVKGIVLGDGNVSGSEARHAVRLIEAFGESEFRTLMQEITARFSSDEELKSFLATIERPEARNLIFGTAMETAFEDGLEGSESSLLDWLVAEWRIDMKLEE